MEATMPAARSIVIPWWVVLLQGIAAVILGLLFIAEPGATIMSIVSVVGIFWFVNGILGGLFVLRNPLWSSIIIPTTLVIVIAIQGLLIGCVNVFMAFKNRSWGLGALGAMNVVLGLVLLGSPIGGMFALAWTYGVCALVGGGASIYTAFRMK